MSDSLHPLPSYLTRIRNVGLLSGEKVVSLFSPSEGVIAEPTAAGPLLITTNQRIISFSQDQDDRETMLFPVEELKGITVKNGSANSLTLWQGLLMIVGGLILYFVVSYWLTKKIDGPSLPLIDIDLGPFVIFIIIIGILAGAWFAWRHYFSPACGLVYLQGSNWGFSFSYQGEQAADEVYQLVNTIFDARNARSGYDPPG